MSENTTESTEEVVVATINAGVGIGWDEIPEAQGKSITLPEAEGVVATVVGFCFQKDVEDKDFTTKEVKGHYTGVSVVLEVLDSEENFPTEDYTDESGAQRVPTDKTKLMKTFPLNLSYWKAKKSKLSLITNAAYKKVLSEEQVRAMDMSELFEGMLGRNIMIDIDKKPGKEQGSFYNNALNFRKDVLKTPAKTYEDFKLPDFMTEGCFSVITV